MNSLEESSPPIKTESPLEKIAKSFVSPPSSESRSQQQSSGSLFDFKNGLIMVLIFLVVLMYLGINVLDILGESLKKLVESARPITGTFFSALGFAAGESINETAEIASDSVEAGIQVAEGVAKDLGNLLIEGSKESDRLRSAVGQKPSGSQGEPAADTSENPIQNPIFAGKRNWCLIGEHQFKRGCVAISDSDKCLSGQVFPNQQMCLNPTFSQN